MGFSVSCLFLDAGSILSLLESMDAETVLDESLPEPGLQDGLQSVSKASEEFAIKWVGDIPYVQVFRTGKVHCGVTQMTLTGSGHFKQVHCQTCACTTAGLTPLTFAACECPCHLLARHYEMRRCLCQSTDAAQP